MRRERTRSKNSSPHSFIMKTIQKATKISFYIFLVLSILSTYLWFFNPSRLQYIATQSNFVILLWCVTLLELAIYKIVSNVHSTFDNVQELIPNGK